MKAKLSGLHSAKILLYSFDFAEIEALQHQGNWNEARDRMMAAAQSLELGGVDCILICSNTLHQMADAVQAVVIPNAAERAIVHDIIYDELCLGQINSASQDQYRQVIASLVFNGAQGIILGCTEIMLLVKPEDSSVPLFDTTALHAAAAVEYASES